MKHTKINKLEFKKDLTGIVAIRVIERVKGLGIL